MDITPVTVPGTGTIHHLRTRHGERLGLIDAAKTGQRTLLLYDAADPDQPDHAVTLDGDEADQLAELLHSRPLADRLAAVERRLAELTGHHR
jgi:TrkA domain protein